MNKKTLQFVLNALMLFFVVGSFALALQSNNKIEWLEEQVVSLEGQVVLQNAVIAMQQKIMNGEQLSYPCGDDIDAAIELFPFYAEKGEDFQLVIRLLQPMVEVCSGP